MIEASEKKMVDLACNALTIAGQEMGKGDHWPVIKATVAQIRKDWEDVQTERNVFEEVRAHHLEMIRELEALCAESPDEFKADIRDTIVNLHEIYEATFTSVNHDHLYINRDELPAYIKRAEAIIETLEDSDEK